LYRDAGEFDGCCHINLGIWNQWLPGYVAEPQTTQSRPTLTRL